MIKAPKESVTIYGDPSDPEVKTSIDKIKRSGRKVKVEPRPSFDSGMGPCGKHQCNCQTPCNL